MVLVGFVLPMAGSRLRSANGRGGDRAVCRHAIIR